MSKPDSSGTTETVLPPFAPVAVRARSDGWLPERQIDFIEALSQCGCVTEAAQRVGMSVGSAYALRQRSDAFSFRKAWDAALDFAIKRLSDAAFGRALNGVATPVFFQGEQIGERRRYDERLTMFLLRYRDPVRYGKWVDGQSHEQHVDGPAQLLNAMIAQLSDAAFGDFIRAETRRRKPAPVRKRTGDVPSSSSTSRTDRRTTA